MKLLLTYSFWKMVFISQNLSTFTQYTFFELLIILGLTLVDILLLGVYFLRKRNAICKRKLQRKPIIKQSWNKNKKIHIFTCLWYWRWKIPVFLCAVNIPLSWTHFFKSSQISISLIRPNNFLLSKCSFFVDDDTICVVENIIAELISTLGMKSQAVIDWF